LRYTSEGDWFCTKINLALASDSVKLQEYSQYIKDLKFCIGKFGKGYTGTLTRGVHLSQKEVDAFEAMGEEPFYIPSFTSASTDTRCSFPKNGKLYIDCKGVGFALKIEDEWTKFPQEKE